VTRPLPACWQGKEILRLRHVGPATEPDNLVHLPGERQGSCLLVADMSSWQSDSPAGRAGRGLLAAVIGGRMEYIIWLSDTAVLRKTSYCLRISHLSVAGVSGQNR